MPLPSDALLRVQQLVQAGMFDAAEAHCRELMQLAPEAAEARSWLGLLLIRRGQFAAAEQPLRRAAELSPSVAQHWMTLSLVLRGLQKTADAETAIRRALALDGTSAAIWGCLGGFLLDQQRWSEAAAAYREAVGLNPADAPTWLQLATAEQQLRHVAAAIEAYERAFSLALPEVAALAKYGDLLVQGGQPQRAIDAARSILASDPRDSGAWLVMGDAHAWLSDMPQAELAYRRALEQTPDNSRARFGLSLALLKQGRLREAEAGLQQLVGDVPDFADGWSLLANVQQACGQIDLAVAALRRAFEISPTPAQHSQLLHTLQCPDSADPQQLLAAHRAWDVPHALPLMPATPPAPRRRSASEPLRVGFVSSDFGSNPSGFLALAPLECLDKSRARVVCYSDRLVEDQYTARFRAAADVWHATSALSDAELAELIRREEIDVLVDMLGHVGRRLLVFARRPAPLQVAWLGYAGTTGLTAMDCLLADPFHIRL